MKIHKLKAGDLPTLGNGLHSGGGGLSLQVRGAARSWVFRYKPRALKLKSSKVMGLGSLRVDDVAASLDDARNGAVDCRRLLAAGLDPRGHRDAKLAKKAEAEAAKVRKATTFLDYAATYITRHQGMWKNEKHRQQWSNTLGVDGGGKRHMDYCDTLHPMPIEDIDVTAITRVLNPIWHNLPETASRIRGRIERILSAATTEGLRSGPNPAVWKDNLANIYPAKRKVRRVRHQPALPWQELPAFLAGLRQRDGVA
jgi:hypothetical protein